MTRARVSPSPVSTASSSYHSPRSLLALGHYTKRQRRVQSAWSDYVVGPFGSLAGANTDDQIDAYIRGLVSTIFHPTGTASMASKSSTTGALNPDLTVKGADGLRVVDASAFPFVPSGNTQGPTYLLAERAADFIKSCNA